MMARSDSRRSTFPLGENIPARFVVPTVARAGCKKSFRDAAAFIAELTQRFGLGMVRSIGIRHGPISNRLDGPSLAKGLA